LDGSDFTSTLRVLLLDSVVVLGASVACAGAGAAAGAAAAVGGACWHPASVKPKAVMATAATNLQEYGFICFCPLFRFGLLHAGAWPFKLLQGSVGQAHECGESLRTPLLV
jgi:hypothetical protein